MGDPITNEVLAERLDQLRRDQRDDLADIKLQLERLVPREVFDLNLSAERASRVALEARVAALEARIRWLLSAVVLPVVAIIVNIWLSTRGGKP